MFDEIFCLKFAYVDRVKGVREIILLLQLGGSATHPVPPTVLQIRVVFPYRGRRVKTFGTQCMCFSLFEYHPIVGAEHMRFSNGYLPYALTPFIKYVFVEVGENKIDICLI